MSLLNLNKIVRVVAPARLHMGFLDLSGSLGRRFGSIGVALSEITTRLSMHPADQLDVVGPQAERAGRLVKKFCGVLRLPDNVFVEIESAIPEHAGLGSGTQMSLAIGAALNQLYSLHLPFRDIARLMDRGERSGIGIGAFEQGGLIVDGGRAESTVTPPVIARLEFPSDWRFLLVFDKRGQGLNGCREIEAFERLAGFSREDAAGICHQILMQALPSIAEKDIRNFGQVITELQESVGNYFAPAQGGHFISPQVDEAIRWLGQNGAVALGQSSWGPTGFCLLALSASARLSRVV